MSGFTNYHTRVKIIVTDFIKHRDLEYNKICGPLLNFAF